MCVCVCVCVCVLCVYVCGCDSQTSDKVVSQVRPKTWRAKNPEKLAELCGTEPYLFDAVYGM